MSKRQDRPTPVNPQASLVGALNELRGNVTALEVTAIDATMLWYAVTGLAGAGASIQIGLTKNRDSWACQMWEGQFPVKDYFSSTDALNKHLAALVRLTWRQRLPPEVEALVREYGW